MTLDLGRCLLCGQAVVYEAGKSPICPECARKQDELYARIRSLLRDYHDCRMSISDVAEFLNVDERDVRFLVESGRFYLVEEWKPKN